MTADQFRESMDSDKSFQAKRRALVFVSLLLIALVVSGAQIKEANTFIFRIEFTNHEGFKYLLVVAVLGCILRYYSYSEKYRDALFSIWSTRLLSDHTIYYYNQEDDSIGGLLGKAISVSDSNYAVSSPEYRKKGFLKRDIGLETTDIHDFYGEVRYTQYFPLQEFDLYWTKSDYRKLLISEFKYRVEAWYKYRETLDLASPYLIAAAALFAFVVTCIER